MEFIIITVLILTLTAYSWWGGYKMGEQKGRSDNDRHVQAPR